MPAVLFQRNRSAVSSGTWTGSDPEPLVPDPDPTHTPPIPDPDPTRTPPIPNPDPSPAPLTPDPTPDPASRARTVVVTGST